MVKVNAHGIQGDTAEWIRNFLAGRRKRVDIGSTNPIATRHQSHLVYHKAIASGLLLFLIYINDLDTNMVNKMSKFADDTKLCHRARNPDDIMELQLGRYQ